MTSHERPAIFTAEFPAYLGRENFLPNQIVILNSASVDCRDFPKFTSEKYHTWIKNLVDNIPNEVPKVSITDDMISEAIKRAGNVRKDEKKLNSFTYKTDGEGLEIGCLGEIIFEQQLKLHNIPRDHWSNDNTTALDYTVRGIKIEIKSKDRNFAPQLNFACTVSKYVAEHQKVDYYYFVSFQKTENSPPGRGGIQWPHTAHLVGASSKNFFKRHSVFLREGDKDGPKNTIKFDCYNIYVEHTIANIGFMVKVLGGSLEYGRYDGRQINKYQHEIDLASGQN